MEFWMHPIWVCKPRVAVELGVGSLGRQESRTLVFRWAGKGRAATAGREL